MQYAGPCISLILFYGEKKQFVVLNHMLYRLPIYVVYLFSHVPLKQRKKKPHNYFYAVFYYIAFYFELLHFVCKMCISKCIKNFLLPFHRLEWELIPNLFYMYLSILKQIVYILTMNNSQIIFHLRTCK